MPKRGPVGRIHGRVMASVACAIAVLGVAAGALALAAPAGAVDHNIRIREIFAGVTTGQPSARFVELQMFAGGQNLVAGNRVHVYNAAGTNVGTFTFPANLAVPTNQSSILVATSQAASFFGVTPDLSMGAVIPPSGGQVCYEDVDDSTAGFRDCVAWGPFTGASPSPTGDPFGPIGGILDGQSILRKISGGLNPNALELADDTDDSADDFELADFDLPDFGPRNNAGAVTTTAGTAAVDAGGVLDFDAASGVNNKVTVADSGLFWRLTDLTAPVDAGDGCEQIFANRVRCAKAGVTTLALSSGDGDDQLTTPDGIDAILDGGADADRLTAKDGTDVLTGGTGRDLLDGGFGPDDLDGGDNQDTVLYERRTAGQPVVADIDGVVGDDGGIEDDDGLGVRDTVFANVEILKGGAGADTLTGSEGPNKLFGNAGADELHGLGANDEIRAKDGTADSITCGSGTNDRLFADLAVDTFNSPDVDCETVS